MFVTEKDLFEETLGAYPIVVNEVGTNVEDSSIMVESVSSPVAKSVDGQDWYWNQCQGSRQGFDTSETLSQFQLGSEVKFRAGFKLFDAYTS